LWVAPPSYFSAATRPAPGLDEGGLWPSGTSQRQIQEGAQMSDAEQILEFIRDEAVDLPAGVVIQSDTSLFRDQLLDSMSLTNLITFLEDEFAIKVGAMDVVFENLDTVDHMVAFVERKRRAAVGG
jgi:acyl carrier protein